MHMWHRPHIVRGYHIVLHHSPLHYSQKIEHRATVMVLRGGLGRAGGPPNLLSRTPWYYAWMIQNFIIVLIFRVRPCACFMKGTIVASSSDQLGRIWSSDCTRTHLRGPRIQKNFWGEGMHPDPPRWSARKCALFMLP